MLEVCARPAAPAADGIWFTSHLNENLAEVATVAELFPGAGTTSDTYDQHGLVTDRSVFAHNVHATDARTGADGRERAPGSRTARPATPRWAAGCSRCAGTSSTASASRSAPTSAPAPDSSAQGGACRPTSCSSCSAPTGLPLTPVHLLYLATRAGARPSVWPTRSGTSSVGKDFDAVWLRPRPAATLAAVLAHAGDATDALARIFALATPADVAGVWVGGSPVNHAHRRPHAFA